MWYMSHQNFPWIRTLSIMVGFFSLVLVLVSVGMIFGVILEREGAFVVMHQPNPLESQ